MFSCSPDIEQCNINNHGGTHLTLVLDTAVTKPNELLRLKKKTINALKKRLDLYCPCSATANQGSVDSFSIDMPGFEDSCGCLIKNPVYVREAVIYTIYPFEKLPELWFSAAENIAQLIIKTRTETGLDVYAVEPANRGIVESALIQSAAAKDAGIRFFWHSAALKDTASKLIYPICAVTSSPLEYGRNIKGSDFKKGDSGLIDIKLKQRPDFPAKAGDLVIFTLDSNTGFLVRIVEFQGKQFTVKGLKNKETAQNLILLAKWGFVPAPVKILSNEVVKGKIDR
ncbi:MAG: hypothetical protein ABIA63_10680 [bacterium]